MGTLITAANSAQAQQLKSLLASADILLGDYLDIPDFMVKTGKLIKTPNPENPAFIHQMLALCLDKGIDKLFALRRSELLLLAEAHQLFAEFSITLYVPERETILKEADMGATPGDITVVENGKIIAGQSTLSGDIWTGAPTGVFINYKIFTAD